MRDNESDGDGGWVQPSGYADPWGSPPPQPPPPQRPSSEYPDTVAYGTPGWYPGSGSGDFLGPVDDGPRGSGRSGRMLVYVLVAVLAAGIGAGATVIVGHHGSPAPAAGVSAGVSSGDVPGPHDNASGSGSSTAPLNARAVARKVDPGLVDIVATLKYNGETAEGTGMIVSAGGLVLTNNHVIDQATQVRATLVTRGSGGTTQYTAKVLGYDSADDVALLQLVGASGLPVESFGNSAQVSLGTPVLALGNAEGRGGAKPARGIINALDRSIQASDEGSNTTENLRHMLQTDARIQQGDSGGALANNAGQVIGMITAANTGSSRGAGASGGTLGFAIPINTALSVARQIAAGKPSATVYIGVPGFLGVEVATSTSQIPQQEAADERQAGVARGGPGASSCQTGSAQGVTPRRIAPAGEGALVVGVICQSAADAAKMAPGDVITAVNGQVITTPGSLTSITATYHPGQIVSVRWVDRNGTQHVTRMELGQGPAR